VTKKTVVRSEPGDIAGNIADAVTYLSDVASEAGYAAVARDLRAIRNRLRTIALKEVPRAPKLRNGTPDARSRRREN
jgi:hypothetical protein